MENPYSILMVNLQGRCRTDGAEAPEDHDGDGVPGISTSELQSK
jgi:hypothetical protein